MEEIKERIKKLLGIEDTLQDGVLDIIIENVSSHLRALLGKDIPSHLDFIVEEISIRRFNRLGAEAMQSESVEGHSVTFYDLSKEFTPYESIIESEREDDNGVSRRGRVIMI